MRKTVPEGGFSRHTLIRAGGRLCGRMQNFMADSMNVSSVLLC